MFRSLNGDDDTVPSRITADRQRSWLRVSPYWVARQRGTPPSQMTDPTTPRPPAGELPEAALEHFAAPRFATECGSSQERLERQQHVDHLLAIARLLHVHDLAAA